MATAHQSMTVFAHWRFIAKDFIFNGLLTKSLLVFWLVGSLPSLAQEVTPSTEEPAGDLANQPSQVIPDRNLETDLQTQVLEAANGRTIEITGGEARGSNLFHSFENFSIESGQTATFQQSSNIENILSRVVGSQPSTIFGTLGVSGDASLWLINPNGIVFGETARLNVSGDFYATTGSAVALGESVFSARDPQQSQLLAVMPETSLMQYLTVDSGDITINSLAVGRELNNGLIGGLAYGDLTLAGRDIVIESAIRRNGNLSLMAFDSITANSRISTAGSMDGGSVSLTAGGDVTTSVVNTSSSARSGDAGNGGSIEITTTRGGAIENRGRLNSRSFAGRSRPGEPTQPDSDAGMGGRIVLTTQAGGDIVNRDSLDSQSNASVGNAAQGGEIVIRALGDGDIVNEGTLRSQSITIAGDAASGGAVTIEAIAGGITNSGVPGNFVDRNNQTGRNSIAAQSATQIGDTQSGGEVTITASSNIENTGSISTYSLTNNGQAGDGGRISVRSTGGGEITNRETLSALSGSNEGPAGSGGDISLETNGEGSITTYRDITAQSISNGRGEDSDTSMGVTSDGGGISIRTEGGDIINRPLAGDRSGNGGSLNSRSVARERPTGDGGDISVVSSQGGRIVLNAYIDAKSYSLEGESGSGGDVYIETSGEAVGNRPTNIVTSAVSNSPIEDDSGNSSSNGDSSSTDPIRGGDVTIRASRVENFNIFTLANRGDSGNVEISSEEDLAIENLQIITNEDVIGGSFDFDSNPLFPATLAPDDNREDPNVPIRITTPQSGQPGDVSIAARRDLVATNLQVLSDAKASTQPSNTMSPNAGDITLSSERSIQLFDSRLETSTSSQGDGGDIRLENSRSVVLDNSALLTNTEGEAQAGNIFIDGFDYLLMRNGSLLQADARGPEGGGSIEIGSARVVASPDGNNDILATATAGVGGDIRFSQGATLFGFESSETSSTRRLRNRRSNDVSARSEFGEDGSITFDAIINDPLRVEPESLDEEFSTPDQLISNSCIAQDELASGSFVIPGSGDLPATPSDASSSLYDLGDVQPLVSGVDESLSEGQPESWAEAQKAWELGDPIVESSAIARLADGRIVFGQQCSAS